MPSNEVVAVPCHGCGRSLRYPAGKAKAEMRRASRIVAFCCRACQLKFVARAAEKQALENAKYAQP